MSELNREQQDIVEEYGFFLCLIAGAIVTFVTIILGVLAGIIPALGFLVLCLMIVFWVVFKVMAKRIRDAADEED